MQAHPFNLRWPMALFLFFLCACTEENPTDSSKKQSDFSGKLVRNITKDISGNNLYVMWVVTSGDDYLYFFGSPNFTSDSTFVVQFDGPPPQKALNSGKLGVGHIILTTGSLVQDSLKRLPDLTGATTRHAIIFKADTTFDQKIPWLRKFGLGYSCGTEDPNTPESADFEHFMPCSKEDLRLIIDLPDNFDWVNWT